MHSDMHNEVVDGAAGAELPMRGTQSVRRALDLLRHVAQGGEKGAKIADLVRESGLDRGTAYRLLTCLVEEQFIDRDEKKVYRLGPEAVLLGSLMPRLTPMLRRLVPVMKRIARISGDTVFLMMRQGDYVQCAHREEGSSLVKVLTTHVGQRRLLGMGTGGAAVTGLISPEELLEAYRRHEAEYAESNFSLDDLQATADAAHAQGYVLTYDAVEVGVAGIGMAFKIGTNGMGAISLGTLTARFGKERRCQLRDLFRSELEGIGLLDRSTRTVSP